jgi:deoxyxylulose-5-phosphate synthase
LLSPIPPHPPKGFAKKYLGTRNIGITMYGDGAANQGQKYEALNMAGACGFRLGVAVRLRIQPVR